ncbi:MAG: FMN-binding negative transcriptional regulator [Proteobacteria bacterium]|nr:MAG: FMN-binding negative transcriptional regulator [Pseudomonadota bacterium]
MPGFVLNRAGSPINYSVLNHRMYIPDHFQENDPFVLRELIEANNFGTLISTLDQRPYATHLPFLYDADRARLLGHMARANPHWRALADDLCDTLVVFQGPHAYVSPSAYVEPGVPTWNYAAIHVYGRFHVLDDAADHRGILETLTERHESARPEPWLADFDSSMLRRMMGATVAFEIVINELMGKFKLSQNRSARDRAKVIEALEIEGTDNATGVADLMRARR